MVFKNLVLLRFPFWLSGTIGITLTMPDQKKLGRTVEEARYQWCSGQELSKEWQLTKKHGLKVKERFLKPRVQWGRCGQGFLAGSGFFGSRYMGIELNRPTKDVLEFWSDAFWDRLIQVGISQLVKKPGFLVLALVLVRLRRWLSGNNYYRNAASLKLNFHFIFKQLISPNYLGRFFISIGSYWFDYAFLLKLLF